MMPDVIFMIKTGIVDFSLNGSYRYTYVIYVHIYIYCVCIFILFQYVKTFKIDSFFLFKSFKNSNGTFLFNFNFKKKSKNPSTTLERITKMVHV